jgi:hypothetical protein
MARLKPWYNVVVPREDLRENRPLDTSEFAIHLDDVRFGRAPKDYCDPGAVLRADVLTESLPKPLPSRAHGGAHPTSIDHPATRRLGERELAAWRATPPPNGARIRML